MASQFKPSYLWQTRYGSYNLPFLDQIRELKMFDMLHCEVCGASDLQKVLDLGSHPLCDDLIKVGDMRVPEEYPIVIGICNTCRTAHQMHQVPKRLLFPASYHYRARLTTDVLNGMRDFVEDCEEHQGTLKGAKVLDVGCNDGSLLEIFAEKGASCLGVEPTDAANDAIESGICVYKGFFTTDLVAKILEEHGQPDIITFTNVFAHIEKLPELLEAVSELMSPTTLLIVENHYFGTVLDKYQFDTFYHEHPRTYSLGSFVEIAKSLEASIVSVGFPSRYGGNIRVGISKAPYKVEKAVTEQLSSILEVEKKFGDRMAKMAYHIPRWQIEKRLEIDALVARYGPLSAKAFPGRAAILIKLLGLNESMVSVVYEKPGSMKIGHYVPGTRIPIVSDEDFKFDSDDGAPILNFAWHISKEINSYMDSRGVTAPIVDIFSPEHFDQIA